MQYAQVAWTASTFADGTAAGGTVTAKAAVLFQAGGRKTALELTIAVPGDGTYSAVTDGGIADPSQSSLGSFNNSHFGEIAVTSSGAACSGSSACKIVLRGFVGGGAGPAATARAIFVYVLGSGTTGKTLHGAFVLKSL